MVPRITQKRKRSTKIRKRTKKYGWAAIFERNKALLSVLWIISSLLAAVLLVVVILQQTILSAKYTIQQVEYAQSSINIYDHPQIYNDISEYLVGKNYFMTKWFGLDTLHEDIISKHSIIKSIAIAQKDNNTLFVELAFNEPNLVFYTPVRRFALYQREFFDLTSGNALGNQADRINLPGYTSGYENLNGILYEIDEEKLIQQIKLIQEILGSQHIATPTYLPGGSKLIIAYKGKTIYFHLDKDITTQLSKITDLETYYPGFADLTVIDAGSVDDLIAR